MSFIFCLFLVCLIWFVVRRLMWLIRPMSQLHRAYRQAQSKAREASRPRERKGGWSTPRYRRKKIDGDVGEYVKFTETSATVTASERPDGSTGVRVEEQITDVEWEDVK